MVHGKCVSIRRVCLCAILLSLVCGQTAHAQTVLPVGDPRSDYRMILRAKQDLGIAPQEHITIFSATVPGVYGSEIHLQYRSDDPVPMKIAPLTERSVRDDAHHFITALLPASQTGDVLIPLLKSSLWRPSGDGVILYMYARTGKEPELLSVSGEDRAGTGERWSAYLRHPFQSEIFNLASINSLNGYHAAGVPLALILAVIGALLFGVLAYKTRRVIASFAIAALFSLLLYHGRFATDLLSVTIRDEYRWQTQGEYREAGDLFLVASTIRKLAAGEESVPRVAACSNFTTMLRYYLFPFEVGSDDDDWKRAEYGAFLNMWEEKDGVVTCDGRARKGRIVATFPEGGAVVRFDPLP